MTLDSHVLDKSFRLVATIHNYGEGPGEYQWIEAVNFNPDRQTIEVLTNKDLIRFTLEGKSIETVKLPFIFGNLQSISADDYLVYSPDIKKGMLEDDFSNDLFLIKWNSLTGNIEPVIYDFKEDVIGSTVDRNNMYRFEGDVYATYVYLDTVFKVSAKGNITKMYINLSDQNLPLELIYGIQPSEILNREEIKQKYAIHFPGLMVNENFFIDRFAKRNRMNFIIQNKRTSTIISGGKVVNDIDGGIDFLMPRFLDEDDNLYTFHEYEEIWAMAQNFEDNTSEFHTFVNSLSPETGFVVVKYHLKNF
ncbi:6-bladed beta-propeller [Algoriphagus antarcticus]|uniref:6-bladed beta-propeller n=2 Tax=Algoriphagus antarcticus TaxID=238540 RepID=UPI0021D02590|nr:6-bladed beta-propeller [Algoriphagus antarcticus]